MKTLASNLRATLVALLLVLGVVGALAPTAMLKPAEAQNTAIGTNEANVAFSQAVTLNATPSLISSAVTSKVLNVRAITITNTASGVVNLYSGNTGAGSTIIASFGLIANTPLPLTEQHLRNGIRTVSGSGLYVNGATGTITITASIRQD